MPIYKVGHIVKELYYIVVRADNMDDARDKSYEVATKYHNPVDSYWYDSKIIEEWDEQDPDIPEPELIL